MAHCCCGNVEVDASGFAFFDHRLHGAKACARQHTFGEIIRAVIDGAHYVRDVADVLGEDDASLVGKGLGLLRDAGVMRFVAAMGEATAVQLSEGLKSQDAAERHLVDGGVYRPGDLVA